MAYSSRDIIRMLLANVGSDPLAIREIAEIAREEVEATLHKRGLVAAGGVAPQLQLTPQASRVQQVMNQLPQSQPAKQQGLPPYTGVGTVYVDAMNNGGGTTVMRKMDGSTFEFQGLLKLRITDDIKLALSHQQNVPNLKGCSFAEAITNGYPINGDVVMDTPLGQFPFAKTSGGKSQKGHLFYRSEKGQPLLIITMNGTFVVLTNVLFSNTPSPLGVSNV